MGKFAIATLVMKGDSYIPGALIMGYSLRQFSSPDIDIVIMITNDVSKEGKYLLSKVFTVIDVPYIEYKSKNALMNNPENEKRYASWIAASYTKWNILNLTQYDKVFLLDADTCALRSIDDVFDFDTPAGIFDTPYSDSYERHGFPDAYKNIRYGDKVPLKLIHKSLNNRGIGAWGTGVLVSPNAKDFKDFHIMMKKLSDTPGGFGFNSHSGVDEQSITHFFWLKNLQWTSLPPVLNVIPWKLKNIRYGTEKISKDCMAHTRKTKKIKGGNSDVPRSVRRISKEMNYYGGDADNSKRKTKNLDKCNLINCPLPFIIHYFGHEKVWNADPNKWMDYRPWFMIMHSFIYNSNFVNLSTSDVKKLEKLFKTDKTFKVKEECFWCKFLDKDYYHHIINKYGKLECPRIKLRC